MAQKIRLEDIDISQATPEQKERAKEAFEHPWSQVLFDGNLKYEDLLRSIMHDDLTVIILEPAKGNYLATGVSPIKG